MAKRKLQKYAELASFKNVIQPGWEELENGFYLKGKWAKGYFNNEHPVILELGCGKGEYTVNLAKQFPLKNFIGIDKKGARLWKGSGQALDTGLQNAVFIRANAESLPLLFGKGELSEIWLTFPDPQPKRKQEKKRLTNPSFLKLYKQVLKKYGIIHLKTDNIPLFDYTLEKIKEEGYHLIDFKRDLYSAPPEWAVSAIKTHYELRFLDKGSKIAYLKFRLRH